MKGTVYAIIAFCLLLAATPLLSADLTGVWRLDRDASESTREMLSAQGYSGFETALLDRAIVTQTIRQFADRIEVESRCTLLKSQENFELDGAWREANSVLGHVRRNAGWDAVERSLVARIRFTTRNGQTAEMTVTRTLQTPTSFRQKMQLTLANGKAFGASQVFRRVGDG